MTTKRRASAKVPALAAGAPAPARTYRKTHLSLGLLPIEVVLYSAVSEGRGSRSMFLPCEDGLHPVGQRKYDKVTGLNIEDESLIVKGVDTENGVVELTDEDLKHGTESVCEIIGFINLKNLTDDNLRLICPTKYYQVRPGRVKQGRESRPNKHAERALLSVFDRMTAMNLHAIVRITITDGEVAKMGLLDSAGHLRILAYQDHIREELPLGNLSDHEVSPQELKTLETVMKTMIMSYLPENPDETISHLATLLAEKQASGQIVALPDQMSSSSVPKLDLLEALEQTLQQRRKPA